MMNYEELYNEMKYSLFTAVKASADVLLELIRCSKNNTIEFETAKHCYNALYEQIDRCNLVEDYEEWEWQERRTSL